MKTKILFAQTILILILGGALFYSCNQPEPQVAERMVERDTTSRDTTVNRDTSLSYVSESERQERTAEANHIPLPETLYVTANKVSESNIQKSSSVTTSHQDRQDYTNPTDTIDNNVALDYRTSISDTLIKGTIFSRISSRGKLLDQSLNYELKYRPTIFTDRIRYRDIETTVTERIVQPETWDVFAGGGLTGSYDGTVGVHDLKAGLGIEDPKERKILYQYGTLRNEHTVSLFITLDW